MKERILSICLALLLFTSCEEWLTVQPDVKMTREDMYKSKTGFEDALNGVYSLLSTAFRPSGPLMMGDVEYMACQWFVEGKTTSNYLMSDHEYEAESVDSRLEAMFKSLYLVLANVNPLIEELYAEEGILDEDVKNKYLGEALAVRAFVNLELIRLWGPLPSDPIESKAYLPYPKEATVEYHEYMNYADFRKELEQDMEESRIHLEKNTSNAYQVLTNRFNYFALRALQARYYLWIGDKEQANACAKEVMAKETTYDNNTFYNLATHQNMSGKEFSYFECENIFGVSNETYMSASANRNLCVWSNHLINEVFEGATNDLRYSQWTLQYTTEEGLGSMMSLNKYARLQVDYTNTKYTINSPLLRLSEMYFIRMECSPLEEANELYKTFCIARGIAAKNLTSEQDVKECMMKEYRREFFGEGQLFFLYKRYFIQNMPQGLKGCNRQSYELPLPTREYILN